MEQKNIIAMCLACHAETHVTIEGRVSRNTVEHESRCPFLAAMEAELGDEYVAKHGYPMRFKIVQTS